MAATKNGLPHFAAGIVVKGFGRGSKELGIPTANFPESVVSALPPSMTVGIYYGLAKVMDGPVHKMVMSVGWNPYYKNTKRSMETHILHKFSEDFYGRWLRVAVLGYIRPEQNFSSLDELITAIHSDIAVAEHQVTPDGVAEYSKHDFFTAHTDTLLDNQLHQSNLHSDTLVHTDELSNHVDQSDRRTSHSDTLNHVDQSSSHTDTPTHSEDKVDNETTLHLKQKNNFQSDKSRDGNALVNGVHSETEVTSVCNKVSKKDKNLDVIQNGVAQNGVTQNGVIQNGVATEADKP